MQTDIYMVKKKMEEQSSNGETAETITDIQNYLASFNKEIQDGGTSGGTTTTIAVEASDGEAGASAPATTTYFVAQSTDGTAVEGYQYDQSDAQYGTTYYASSDGTYYAATTSSQGAADAIAYTAQGATVVPVAAQSGTYQTVATGEHGGLQQIVLAVSDAGGTGAGGGKRQELVAIPATLATQAGGVAGQEQTTFVAIQPGPDDSHMDSGQDGPRQAMATLVTTDASGQIQTDGSHEPTHTIRMVLRQPDGTEMEQTIPIQSSTARVPTLISSDGQTATASDEGTLQMMASLAEQASQGGFTDGNQVIVNVGNSYQTVTVVPTDGNQGEMSYMLIVAQSDEDKDTAKDMDLDMSVYDFSEDKQHGEIVSEEVSPDGTKTRTIRITQKKSQIVTQAHMCNYCNYTSPKRYLLSRHMKSHSEERPHKCGVCERGFKTLAALQNHVNTHTGTRPHCCRDCESSFTTSGELVRHVRYRHTHEKPHKCTECDYASVELSKLKRHMRCHTGERPYQCPHCTYASPDMYKLKRHLRIHTGEKPYECDICQARFTQSNSLKAHKLIHSGNKPAFHCEFCPTTCGRKTDLRIHMQKLHTSDKPLKCKRCGKTFPDRYSYKLHSKTHEGEKCFKCDLCPYASISQRHLESHMLIHTDQKPFRCDECDQAFRQKQLLRRHKNLYHNPNYVPPVPKEKTNECSDCGKAFRHKGNLIRHLAIHDPDASENDKAEALRIGAPKAPGEQRDGEEEEDEDVEEEDIDFSNAIRIATQEPGQENEEQVVVFEVIRLHSQEAKAAAMSEEDGMTIENGVSGELTVLRDVDDEECYANPVEESVIEESEDIPVPPTPRRRGRPRKYPVAETPKLAKILEAKEETATTRTTRKRKITVREVSSEEEIDEDDPEFTPMGPTKKGRPLRQCRVKREDAPATPPELIAVNTESTEDAAAAADRIELARRQAELTKRRLQQKEKDMAECFGFNDDEEETATILAMPTVPGTKNMIHMEESLQNHNGGIEQETT